MFEETLLRVYIFESVYKNIIIRQHKKRIILSIFIASFLFGIAHVTTIFNPNVIKITVINQIAFAFSLGILFQSIYIKTKSLFLISTLHALVNYYGSYKTALFLNDKSNQIIDYSIGNLLISLLLIIFISLILILPISYLLIKKKLND
jgi:membrane protease YdiL (CAAX protease family)